MEIGVHLDSHMIIKTNKWIHIKYIMKNLKAICVSLKTPEMQPRFLVEMGERHRENVQYF